MCLYVYVYECFIALGLKEREWVFIPALTIPS